MFISRNIKGTENYLEIGLVVAGIIEDVATKHKNGLHHHHHHLNNKVASTVTY